MKPYTEEMTIDMVNWYSKQPTRTTVSWLAGKYGKTEKSIISKLSIEGVYKREIYVSKTGEVPITKVDIVADIANALEVEKESLEGLEKAPKQVLKRISEALGISQ